MLLMFRVCHAVLSVHCSLVVTCWERANLLALFCVMFSCVSAAFPRGVLGQMWYLIVSIPDICLLSYFAFILTFCEVIFIFIQILAEHGVSKR